MGEMNWIQTSIVFLIISIIAYGIRIVNPKKVIHELGWGALLLSALCMIVSLFVRSQKAEYFALSNMYESLLVVIIWMSVAFLVLDRWFKKRALGLPVTAMIGLSLWYDLTLPTNIAPLQPALQSYWRSIHVPIILLSYALFTLAFLCSLVYLVKHFTSKNNTGNRDSSGGSAQLATNTGMMFDQIDEMEGEDIYDEITYRCVAFGVPLLAIGIILGGMWANEAWGNYWSWDPKESMSLVTLLGYGVYLHLRVNAEHHPKTLAWVSVASFILLLVTYFGVNIMGIGLHSYGKIG